MSNIKGQKTVGAELETALRQVRDDSYEENMQNLDDYANVQDWEKIRQKLKLHGTDIAKNAADPAGDGDQRPIKNHEHAQLHRDIWSAGADVQHLFLNGGLPHFVMACVIGSVEGCRKMINECPDVKAKTALLETRFSLLRLSPIFLAAIGFGTVGAIGGVRNDGSGHIGVMRLLLEHGARPDARDVCGKTIIHYCCGPLCKPGSKVLLDMADLCIARAAELGLPKLVDIRDRFGGVAMQQAVMLMRPDLVQFLCSKHKADANIKDYDGCSPYTMADVIPSIRSIIANAQGQTNYQQFKAVCVQCQATGVPTSRCARCNIATYCSKECQVLHAAIVRPPRSANKSFVYCALLY
jgi:hypothetical protein